MKLTDITNNKAKEIIEGAPKEATHFSCIEGKTQYYKNETVISSLDEVFINVFRDIFQPSVFLLSDLENQMNIDKVETQTENQEEKSALISANKMNESVDELLSGLKGESEWKNGDECVYRGEIWQFVSLLSPAHHGTAVIFCVETEKIRQVASVSLSKPETKKQREDRERLEAAYDLFVCASDGDVAVNPNLKDWESKYPSVLKMWLRVVDKTNYRKGVE